MGVSGGKVCAGVVGVWWGTGLGGGGRVAGVGPGACARGGGGARGGRHVRGQRGTGDWNLTDGVGGGIVVSVEQDGWVARPGEESPLGSKRTSRDWRRAAPDRGRTRDAG